MKKRTMRWASAGLLLSLFTASLGMNPPGGGNVSAAAPKSMAAIYTQIQNERAAKVVSLVNKERETAGLKPLIVHTNLTKMAKDKAIDMYKNQYFSHTSPVFGSPFDMMDAYNITYRYAGENIAKGQKSAEEVVKDWMNSPGHKANILNSNYKLIGVGYYNGYWVQEFIGK
ncbi:Cysteine-rich secretory protein family protein [compost metagenome]